MKPLDFLTLREVLDDCIRQVALPSLAVIIVGCLIWALLAAFGQSDADQPRLALVIPFVLSAIYGNVVVYNVKAEHGIKVFARPWWFHLTALAVVWSASLSALSMLIDFGLVGLGVLESLRSVREAVQFVLVTAISSIFFSLLPAKGRLILW